MTLAEQFQSNLIRVERIFSVPDLLRKHFLSALDTAQKDLSLPHSTKNKLQNQSKVLANINHETMAAARQEYYSILFEDTIIFIVSVAEQILKNIFNELVKNNLEKLDITEDFTVKFIDLKNIDFQTDKSFWSQQIIDEIQGMRSPQEKANFQNILAIEDLFKKYFKIIVEDKNYRTAANRAHYFFQVRHILVHNAGVIDQRFITNVGKVGVKISEAKLGTHIDISRDEYDQCKYFFGSIFHHLDTAINDAGLKLG